MKDFPCKIQPRGWGGYVIDVMTMGAYTTYRVFQYTNCVQEYTAVQHTHCVQEYLKLKNSTD